MSNQVKSNNLDSFSGTFAISNHNLISEVLVEYLFEVFYNQIDSKWIGNRQHILAPISLEEINNALNEIWDGPGSVAKIKTIIKASRNERIGEITDDTTLKNYVVPTINDDLD